MTDAESKFCDAFYNALRSGMEYPGNVYTLILETSIRFADDENARRASEWEVETGVSLPPLESEVAARE